MTLSMLKQRLKNLREQGERGSILILVVLSALIIIGSAGLAVDVGRLYAAKAELSRAVDAAALSGVLEFNGTAGGLTNASTKACSYLQANEPAASCSGISPNGANSTLTINASKTVRLYFLPIFGINTSIVSAHAISGFNNATVDAVMVIDSTYSMNGAPITNAKTAATSFKDTLLGTSPSGNVYVGIAPLRGCYRPSPSTFSDCVYNTVQSGSPPPTYVKDLTSNSGNLDTAISAVVPGGMSATNVCTGLGKGYEVINSSGGWGYATGHQSSSNNRRFMVLLSDADNVYFGGNVYVAGPPKSPNSFAVGAGTFDCQPPNNCSGWGSPCHNGTYTSGAITLASDGFTTSSWSNTGGTPGWTGAWIPSGNASTVSTGTPQAGTYHARLAQTGAINRQFNLSTASAATVTFWAKQAAWSSSDRAYAEISSDGSIWTTVGTYSTGAGLGTTYRQFTINLNSSYVGDASVYLRFRASTSASTRYFYVDTISITDPNTTSTGYLNGQDGQNYTSCSETPAPRERQLDVLTLNLAQAIKAQGVEIFVVSFSACADTDGTTIYNNAGNTTCASQANPLVSAPASGKVGDTTSELTANMRLAKCIASSTAGTNDHYWYETNAANLPAIFTTIAAQIAHRLVE